MLRRHRDVKDRREKTDAGPGSPALKLQPQKMKPNQRPHISQIASKLLPGRAEHFLPLILMKSREAEGSYTQKTLPGMSSRKGIPTDPPYRDFRLA